MSCFLVDPLDGTNEFTVNIALVENTVPIFGMIFAPALRELYVTLGPNEVVRAELDPFGPVAEFDSLAFTKIRAGQRTDGGLSVVASKSHMTEETGNYISEFQVSDVQGAGSFLKFCLLARGDADL